MAQCATPQQQQQQQTGEALQQQQTTSTSAVATASGPIGSSKAVATFKVPGPRPVPKRKPDVVLDEDEWTDKLEGIIERDFFPELAKMQSKLEWTTAVRSGDPELIRQAQRNIAQRRAGIRTPMLQASAQPGAELATPGMTGYREPTGGSMLGTGATPALPRPNTGVSAVATPSLLATEAAAMAAAAGVPPEGLDEFVSRHTSEDNASFREILDAHNARKRQRLAERNASAEAAAAAAAAAGRRRQQLALQSAEGASAEEGYSNDGFGTTGQEPMTLQAAPVPPVNRLMYGLAQSGTELALSAAELAQRVAGPPKKVVHANTRLPPAAAAAKPPRPAAAAAPAAAGPGVVPAQAGGLTPSQYGYLPSPSMTPSAGGGGASPFVTWGDIEGTPMRLGEDEEDELAALLPPPGSTSFRLPEVRQREALARGMTAKAGTSLHRRAVAKYLGQYGGVAADALRRASSGRGGRRPGTDGGGGRRMSEAGRRLAASLRGRGALTPGAAGGGTGRGGGGGGADLQLRASYSGAGAATPGSVRRTPGGLTPAATPLRGAGGAAVVHGSKPRASSRSSAATSSAAAGAKGAGAAAGAEAGGGGHVTDNLLNL